MFERVLVTTDGSPLGNQALPVAQAIANKSQVPLTVLHVATVPVLADARPHQEDRSDALMLEGEQVLQAAQLLLNDPAVTTILRVDPAGSVAEVIAEETQEGGPCLLVMATHGRTGLGRMLFGSVAEQVMRLVRVPVVLVPLEGRD